MDSIFLWEWNSVGNRDIKEEIERRKNLSLTNHRLDVAVKQYKKETNWKPTKVKAPKISIKGWKLRTKAPWIKED